MQGPGGQTSAPPATADVIAAQSQDYVDENLAAFQVKNIINFVLTSMFSKSLSKTSLIIQTTVSVKRKQKNKKHVN